MPSRAEQQASLSGEVGRLAKQYLARYRIATDRVVARVAKGERAVNDDQYREFRTELVEFGEQAAILARRSGRERYVVVYSASDAPGVVAKLSACLASQQFNIEAATMAVIGNLVTTAMVVSGPRAHSLAMADDTAHKERAIETARSVQTQMVASLGSNSGDTLRVLARPEVPEISWPRRGSSVWHLRARLGGHHPVSQVTTVIAERGLALLTFAVWMERKDHIVDLTLAVPPPTSDDDRHDSDLLLGLQDTLEAVLGFGSLLITPVDRPTRGASGPSVLVPAKARLITIVGEARPGFVNAVITKLYSFSDLGVEIVGANMAILEVYSVLTVVLRVTNAGSDQVWTRIARGLRRSLDERDEVLEPYSVRVESAPARDQPTHELTVESTEQPGVLAKVSELLSGAHPSVNIVWLSSYVLEPRIGEDRLRCWMQLQIDLSSREEEAVRSLQQQLGWLAAQNGWSCESLREIGV